MSAGRAAALLRGARTAVALTGAGISTESGLPDFRSPGGLWAGVDPMRVASLTAFRENPDAFYVFYRRRLALLAGAGPNPGHRALARLEAIGRLRAVITQNVDGLHQAAGSRRVLEVHGSLRRAACPACGARAPITVLDEALARGGRPRCGACAGLLKPDVVLFEELLPVDVFQEAETWCRRADVLLVVGSSLQVWPAASLPEIVLQHGGRLVIINHEPTPYDPAAACVIRTSAGMVLPEIAAALGAGDAGEGAGGTDPGAEGSERLSRAEGAG